MQFINRTQMRMDLSYLVTPRRAPAQKRTNMEISVKLQGTDEAFCDRCGTMRTQYGTPVRRDAVLRCKRCWMVLCDTCGYNHLLEKAAQEHTLEPIESGEPGPDANQNVTPDGLPESLRYLPMAHPPDDWREQSRNSINSVFTHSLSQITSHSSEGSTGRPAAQSPPLIATIMGEMDSGSRDVASGCCFLPDGSAVITRDNRKLLQVLVPPSFNAIAKTFLPVQPYDVTAIRAGIWAHLRLAVTAEDRQIFFYKVETNGKIRLFQHETIHTQKQYFSITSIPNNMLAVTAPWTHSPCVDIIHTNGDIMRTFGADYPALFTWPRYISATTTAVVVSDSIRNTLTIISPNGKTLILEIPNDPDDPPASPREKVELFGVTVFKHWILAADKYGSAIYYWTTEGEFNGSLLIANGGVREPVALDVSFDGNLVVTQGDGRVRLLYVAQQT